MSKLIAEADKLLDKNKIPEAIEKLKAALAAEPLNQLVATKLANVYAEQDEKEKAAKVYISLASRLSDAGKAQVAIAIYKQALELDPANIELKVKFALECESVGKVGDAANQAALALQFYLRRKKYFDATNVVPILARIQNKDEKYKLAWVDILQFSQAEQKLVHLLVAVCGPPGLVSQEFPTGGDPALISDTLYEGLKRLVPIFPRDPKVAYAVAWAAHRRGRDRDFFFYLRECIRREPDFCLALLLWARVLAEKQKLNESLFIYKYLKERMASDKSVDLLTLNRLLEAFVEKNGWITFTEGLGVEELDAAGFLRSVTGSSSVAPTAPAAPSASAPMPPPLPSGNKPPIPGAVLESNLPSSTATSTASDAPVEARSGSSLKEEEKAPAEIELSSSNDEGMELQLSSSAPLSMRPASIPSAAASPAPVATPAPVVASPPTIAEKETPLRETDNSVEFTSIIKVSEQEIKSADPVVSAPVASPPVESSPNVPAPQSAAPVAEIPLSEDALEPAQEVAPPQRRTFNPLEQINTENLKSTSERELEERTQMFSPMDLLGAANIVQNDVAKVDTKVTLQAQSDLGKATPPQPTPSTPLPTSMSEVRSMNVEGSETKIFSPVEAVQAGVASRKPYSISSNVETKLIGAGDPPLPPTPEAMDKAPQPFVADVTKTEAISFTASEAMADPLEALANSEGEATLMIQMGVAASPKVAPENAAVAEAEFAKQWGIESQAEAGLDQDAAGTMILTMPKAEESPPEPQIPEASVAEGPPAVFQPPVRPSPPSASVFASPPEPPSSGAFAKIPELKQTEASVTEETIDLGDDLLEGPTKLLVVKSNNDATAHLFKEIKKDIKEKKVKSPSNVEYMLRKAERYIAKRNYYLARKALRHSLALGADESKVKARLGDIRRLELPDGLYNSMSSDQGSKEASGEILDRLEQEFDLNGLEQGFDEDEVSASVEGHMEAIFESTDPRTILDFGVGLHEMGLFRQAELVFGRLVDEHPDLAFDAYYLAAISKFSRKDYAGAASILKKLSTDGGKTEQEKIQIYYALGELFEKMRRPERSKEFFRKVAELDSDYRNIRHKLDK